MRIENGMLVACYISDLGDPLAIGVTGDSRSVGRASTNFNVDTRRGLNWNREGQPHPFHRDSFVEILE